MRRLFPILALLAAPALALPPAAFDEWYQATPASGSSEYNPWFWVDAEDSASLTMNSTNVSKWADCRANGIFAEQTNTLYQPYLSTDGKSGKPVVDFAAYSVGGSPWMPWSVTSTTIRTVFAVWQKGIYNNNIPIIGHLSLYPWLGGNTYTNLFNPQFVSTAISNGVVTINDSVVLSPWYMTTNFNSIAIAATGNVAGANFAKDRANNSGGQRIAEMMIFTNPVDDATAAEIRAYLKAKWSTP